MGNNFRTLNYLGSKLRLLDFIEDNVLNITEEGDGVCDLFAGSGCVSLRLSEQFHVFSCDIQRYSKVICNALMNDFGVTHEDADSFMKKIGGDHTLFDCFLPLIEKEENAINEKNIEVLADIVEHGSVEVFNLEHNHSSLDFQLRAVSEKLRTEGLFNERSLISRYYGGVYFSYRQAVCIDEVLEALSVHVEEKKHDLFLAALLSTASDVVGTVGKHFAQPIKVRDSKGKIKGTVYNKARKDKCLDIKNLYDMWLRRYIDLQKTGNGFDFFLGDYMDCLKSLPENVTTIYADPPYTRDHYSRYYHVLETITNRDSPELSETNIHGDKHISNGIYRKERYQSPFCIKSKAQEAFVAMFEFASKTDRNLLLSYSPYDETRKTHPRVVTIHQLLTWAGEYFKSVELVSAGSFKHNKLNSTERLLNASDEAELLMICTNKKT